MSTFKPSFFVQAPVLALLAFAAACGGSDQAGGNGGTASTETAPAAEAPAVPAGDQTAAAAPAGQGQVIEIHMKTTNGGSSGVFEPAQVTAKKGDILRFVNDGGAAHNANFAGAPENAGKSGLPGATPYATAAGQSVDVPVTMEPGTYAFQCDPHAAMGMKGQLTVQ